MAYGTAELFPQARPERPERQSGAPTRAASPAKPRVAAPTAVPEPDQAPPPLSVSALNERAKRLLEGQLGVVSVVGEISNFKTVSGHHYFTLKDPTSQLPAAMFRRDAGKLRFRPEPGMEVVATGRLTVYGPYGRYQMVVERLEPRGAGALQAAFEALKRQLAQEGLFDPARKRRLPLLPGRVGVVTSPTGAVIRDIVNVSTRRFPRAQLLVFPTRVQGPESGPAIAQAIKRASAQAQRLGLRVLVVARGGGSLEDLWGFNEEVVARAIAACPIPVVSAVGHETDVTISDFVADCRAPTPSAAAELVFPVRSELLEQLRLHLRRASRALQRDVHLRRHRLLAARARLGDGRGRIREQAQRLSYLETGLEQRLRAVFGRHRLRLQKLEGRLARLHPRVGLRQHRVAIDGQQRRLGLLMQGRLRREQQRLDGVVGKLEALSPVAILDRGYSIVLDPAGQALRDASAVTVGDAVQVRLARGELGARVEQVTSTHPETAPTTDHNKQTT